MPPMSLTAMAPDPELEAALTALEVECEEKVAALKAEYAAKREALIESHSTAEDVS